MGRRKPQRDILVYEAEVRQEGRGLPFFGLPADSGYEIDFAKRLLGEVDDSESLNPPEWETLYSRDCGKKTLYHQRSRITGRARLQSEQNLFKDEQDNVTRTMVMYRTIHSASSAHTVTAERKAMRKLRTHLSASQWRMYVLTGMFAEWSKRSGVYYIFRRVAPTVVCKMVASEEGMYLRPFVTLCMHPVGYTARSGTGCMCPTDDIIAHLLLMRSDEHLYWKKSVHHQVSEVVSFL